MNAALLAGLLAVAAVGAASDQEPAAGRPFPVTIRVDLSRSLGALAPIWRFFGGDEPNYATMKDGRKLLAELGELRPRAGLLPDPQPAQHRRRHAGAQVGQHERLHGRRARAAPLRLDRHRPDLRRVPRARRAPLRRDRLHAPGTLDEARAVPARVAAGSPVRRRLHGLGLSAEGLREVGRARLRVGSVTASKGTERRRSQPGTGRPGTRRTSATGGARPRSSSSFTTTRSPPCAARCRRHAWAGPTWPAPTRRS